MKLTLVDEQGMEFTEITSHLGGSSGQVVVDWATRPDALFQNYFDRGSRHVTAAIGASEWSAVLGTRWQMGARRWFLSEFLPVRSATEAVEHAPPAVFVRGASDIGASPAAADLDATGVARTSAPRGVPV